MKRIEKDASALVAQAEGNVEKWGAQDIPTLILAMTEELGEIAKAHLQHTHEGGDLSRVFDEAVDLGALCLQLLALKSGARVLHLDPQLGFIYYVITLGDELVSYGQFSSFGKAAAFARGATIDLVRCDTGFRANEAVNACRNYGWTDDRTVNVPAMIAEYEKGRGEAA